MNSETGNSAKKNNRILLLLFAGVLMGALDLAISGPAIPAIEKSMLIHGRDLSRIFSTYVLFYLFGIPLMSKLSDIHGRRLIYMSSIAIFGIGAGIVSLSDNITVLLIGRAVQGFGSSGIFPVAAATIGDVFPSEKRGRALGLLGAVFGIAFVLGPLIAGSILFYFDWNILYLLNLPIAALLILLSWRLLPGKPRGEKPGIGWVGIIMLIIVLASFSLGLNNIQADSFGVSLVSASVLPFLIVVLILTPILIAYERKRQDSFLSIQMFRSAQVRLTLIISFGLGLFQSGIVFLPKLAIVLFSVSPSKASFMLLPLVLSTALVPPLSGILLDKIGSRIVIITGLFFALGALFLFSVLPENIALFYVAEVALGIGIAIRASLKYIVLNETGARDRAASLGMLIIWISLGQITGATLIGAIISGSHGESTGFGYAFLVLTAISAMLVLMSFFLKRKKKCPLRKVNL